MLSANTSCRCGRWSIAMLVLMAGCVPRPMAYGERGPARSAAELLQWIALAEGAVVSLKGEAGLAVDGAEGKGSTSLYIEAAAPGRLHLEQLDFFGRPQAVLVSDGVTFGYYDGRAARYYMGPATQANLERFLSVGMPMADLVELLLGRVPRVATDTARFTVDASRGVYVLALQRGPRTQSLEVDPATARVLRSADAQGTGYEVEFSGVRSLGAVSFPKRLVLTRSRDGMRMDLTWRELSLNQPPDATAFQAAPPEGVPVTVVSAAGMAEAGAP